MLIPAYQCLFFPQNCKAERIFHALILRLVLIKRTKSFSQTFYYLFHANDENPQAGVTEYQQVLKFISIQSNDIHVFYIGIHPYNITCRPMIIFIRCLVDGKIKFKIFFNSVTSSHYNFLLFQFYCFMQKMRHHLNMFAASAKEPCAFVYIVKIRSCELYIVFLLFVILFRILSKIVQVNWLVIEYA